MNYKKISKISIISFLTIAFIFPSISLAINEDIKAKIEARKEEIQEKKNEKKIEIEKKRTEKTCDVISKDAEKIQGRLADRLSKITQKRTDIESKIQERVQERAQNRVERRSKWQENKEEVWAKLKEIAKNDEQKAAIEKFIETIQTAVKDKNDAIDAIISEIHAKIKTMNQERKNGLDSQLDDYGDTIAEIVTQVKSDCNSGKNARDIREYFKTQMKATRDQFKNQEQIRMKTKTQLETLRDSKKEEIQAVFDTFKSTIEIAKKELRAVFSDDEEDLRNDLDEKDEETSEVENETSEK